MLKNMLYSWTKGFFFGEIGINLGENGITPIKA
jgi:hypothetical protein